ncbi:hypothetical protein R1flu_018110 [Riccia fluitans]|uniref:Uncharacterized protein n=1 Tax=Riccia fluitans TaxID=41844 RepID=A0ABD1ZEW1_9MARC
MEGASYLAEPLLDKQREGSEIPANRISSGNNDWICKNSGVCGLADTSSDAAQRERSKATKKLTRAVIFCAVFMVVEIIGGIKAGSLAILTDAVHLSSDVASFAISLFAVWAGGWEANPRHTFGFYRAEVLGALISILIIWLVTGSIVYEAINRLFTHQAPIDGRLMFIVASLGLLVNIVMMALLGHDHGGHGHDHDHDHGHGPGDGHSHGDEGSRGTEHVGDQHVHNDDEEALYAATGEERSRSTKDFDPNQHRQECRKRNLVVRESDEIIVCICDEVQRPFERKLIIDKASSEAHDACRGGPSKGEENVNVKSAYLHVLGDLVQSVGVMIGGAIIWWNPKLIIVDLICTLLFSVLVLWTTLRMVRDILAVLMESTPREIDANALEKGIMGIEGVEAVHELHIWAITLGKVILACHVTVKDNACADAVLQNVIHYCDSKFKISHVTIQIERAKNSAQGNTVESDCSTGHGGHDHDHGQDHDHHHKH